MAAPVMVEPSLPECYRAAQGLIAEELADLWGPDTPVQVARITCKVLDPDA